jgi:hypothetical protein
VRIQVSVIDKGLCPRQHLLVNIWNVGLSDWVCLTGLLSNDGQLFPNPVKEGLPTSRELIGLVKRSAFMSTQLISCRLLKADSALLRSSLFHHLCRFVSSSSGERQRGSLFAEASDPAGSRNGSTAMRS